MSVILESQRLQSRRFTFADARFIIELVNTPGWLQFIGDRNVRTEAQAISYLENGPIKSYRDHGFGLYLVELKDTNVPIGMCGFLKRESLETPDMGFAFMPQYSGQGYAFEIAKATLDYARNVLKLSRLSGITHPANVRSIRLLETLGMRIEKKIHVENESNELLLYSVHLQSPVN